MLMVALGALRCRTDLRPANPTPRRFEVQGHRGCRGLLPENTLAAFEHAAALGVDVLELDLGLTRDGVLVVAHDPQANPDLCLGVDRLPTRDIKDLTFAQLERLDCGSRSNPRFPDQRPVPGARMPRLEEVLDLLGRRDGLQANLEVKTFPDRRSATAPPASFAETLVPLLLRRGLERRVTIQSFDPLALREVAKLAGGRLALSALADRREDFEPMLRSTGARILSPRHTELRRADVVRFRRRGVRLIPWTVNEPARMRELMDWGVDGLITDRPDRLLRLLRRSPAADPLPHDG
jgi:glycerophosphoryl diester phosphodiesterase